MFMIAVCPSGQTTICYMTEMTTRDQLGTQLLNRISAGELNASKRVAPKNSNIYNSGDSDQHVYIVREGRIKLSTFSRDGKRCLLSIYSVRDVFGELCLLPQARRETATAMTDATLWQIPAGAFQRAITGGDLTDSFLSLLTTRLSEQQRTITNMVTMESRERLAAVLLQLGHKLGIRRSQRLYVHDRITQEELAAMVGTTRSRVGYFLKEFVEKGLIAHTPGCFLILHETRLCSYLESAG
jgi:CRP/FNR family transcriptional regulator, cyclic AMP receptor protein